MIRRLAVLLYLGLTVVLAGGVAVVGEAVAEYGVQKEELATVKSQVVARVITELQEEQEQIEAHKERVEAQAVRWRKRVAQLEQYISAQGLAVPLPPRRVEPEPSVPPPAAPVESPTPESVVTLLPEPTLEPPPFTPPPPELPPIQCVEFPPPVPDFCVEVPPTPTPNP